MTHTANSNQIEYPLISVVMATYNGEKFINEQIQSIIDQDYPNLEIIIIDDASTDHTQRIVREYAVKDSRISYIFNDKNIGYIKNFQKAIELARGAYIALSDQDDIWLKEKISTLFKAANGYPIVYADSFLIDENGINLNQKLSQIKRLVDFNSCLSYAIGGSVPGHAMLIRKDIVRKALPLPEIFPHDYWIGFIATIEGTIKYLDLPLQLYRQHQHSIFGAGISKVKKTKPSRKDRIAGKRMRMELLASACSHGKPEKKVYETLAEMYKNFGISSRFKRALLFFQYRDQILAYKHRSFLEKFLFCVKTFFKLP